MVHKVCQIESLSGGDGFPRKRDPARTHCRSNALMRLFTGRYNSEIPTAVTPDPIGTRPSPA